MLSRSARSAIRQHRRNEEQRLIYSKDRKAFFTFVNNKCGSQTQPINLLQNGATLTDYEAAEHFQREFCNNFSAAACKPSTFTCPNASTARAQFPLLNSSETLILDAIRNCSNTNSSPDGVSFHLIKSIAKYIVQPLNMVFQHCFYECIFPSAWKCAVILPLYKGRGERNDVASYRPISLCACLGKVMEKVVCTQLVLFISGNNLLHQSQHGFTSGRSTTTNILQFDAVIADVLSHDHAYDVISVDFKKAFDKAPHHRVIASLSHIGVCGKALNWFLSFLSGRTQQVRVGNSLSTCSYVSSGVIQGSILGPVLFTVFTDSLLRKTTMPVVGFADDFKFLADVSLHTRQEVQAVIDAIIQWSDENNMPLSTDKCAVMHCGHQQPLHMYYIHGLPLAIVDSFQDLGVRRTACATYNGHCAQLAAKASRVAGSIRRAFPSASRKLRWPAFQTYVLPVIMYLSQAWHPKLKRDVNLLEKVQRRFTKAIKGLRDLTYVERLRELQALTIANRMIYADMVFIHKCLHGKVNVAASDLGLFPRSSNTRADGRRLIQRHTDCRTSNLFCFRAVSVWNKLPIHIVSCNSIPVFKHRLYRHLFLTQS